MKQMFVGMNQNKSNAFVDSLESVIHQFSVLFSLFTTEYDAGEFCKGLIFAKMVSTIMMKVFGNFYSSIFQPTREGDVNPAIKELMGSALK